MLCGLLAWIYHGLQSSWTHLHHQYVECQNVAQWQNTWEPASIRYQFFVSNISLSLIRSTIFHHQSPIECINIWTGTENSTRHRSWGSWWMFDQYDVPEVSKSIFNDFCSANNFNAFPHRQEGNRLFHNVEMGPCDEGQDQSQLNILTASRGENIIHTNKWVRYGPIHPLQSFNSHNLLQVLTSSHQRSHWTYCRFEQCSFGCFLSFWCTQN